MTIYKTAYDTSVGKNFNISKIKNAILETRIKEPESYFLYGLANRYEDMVPMFIASRVDHEANIPFFVHPMLVSLEPIKQKETLICSDIRSFASYNTRSVSDNDLLNVRNKMELDLIKLRTILNILWIKERPLNLRDISSVPAAIFASWISETIAKRYALDPKDQVTIMIVTILYYNGLFTDSEELTPDEEVRTVAMIMKITRMSSSIVTSIMDRIKDIDLQNINDLALAIRSITDNTRLEDFNSGVLISLLITSWFGANSKEMLAVALEHPPTWLAIVYSSFVERSYRNSGIAKISQRYLLGKGETEFVRSLVTMIKNSQQ